MLASTEPPMLPGSFFDHQLSFTAASPLLLSGISSAAAGPMSISSAQVARIDDGRKLFVKRSVPFFASISGRSEQLFGVTSEVLTSASSSLSTLRDAEAGLFEPQKGGSTPMQLWLQDQLEKVPMFAPMVKRAKEARAAATGGQAAAAPPPDASASPAAGSSGAEAVRKSATSKRKPLKKPKISKDDQPLWDLFQEMDTNGDGTVDVSEMRTALARLGLPCSPAYVDQMMRRFNTEGGDSNDSVTWDNFKHYVSDREKQVAAAFSMFDVDGGGTIDASELGKVMAQAGLPTTGRDIRKVMDILDKDHDGTITYEEFRRWACMVPAGELGGGGTALYAGWLRGAPTVTKQVAAARRPRTNIMTDPRQQFMAFDLLLRTCMAGTLAFLVLVALRQD